MEIDISALCGALAPGDYSLFVFVRDNTGTDGAELEIQFTIDPPRRPWWKKALQTAGPIVAILCGIGLIGWGGWNAVKAFRGAKTTSDAALLAAVADLARVQATNAINDGQYRALAAQAMTEANEAKARAEMLARQLSGIPLDEFTNMAHRLGSNGSIMVIHGNVGDGNNFVVGANNGNGTQAIVLSTYPVKRQPQKPRPAATAASPALMPTVTVNQSVVNQTLATNSASASITNSTSTVMPPPQPPTTNTSVSVTVTNVVAPVVSSSPVVKVPIFYSYAYPTYVVYEDRCVSIWPFRCRCSRHRRIS
jgi:hypothetical protein